jgi:hypothetical protein
MNTKKAGTVAVTALMVISVVPVPFDNPHIEMIEGQQDSAMLMDAAIISTHTGAAATLGYWVREYHEPKDFT